MDSSQPDPNDPNMEATIDEMLQTKLSLSSISVSGAKRTSPTLLDRLTSPAISTGGTFASVVEDVSKAVDLLRATDCYKGVDAFLDSEPNASSKAIFTLSEKSFYQIHTGAHVETSAGSRRDPSVEASFVWRNLTGQADSLKASASWMNGSAGDAIATRPSSRFQIDYKRPFALDLRAGLSTLVSSSMHNYEQNSSHSLALKSAQVAIDHPFGQLSFNTDWRNVLHVLDKASPLVHADAGHSWKTSVKESIEIDRRDNRRMPSSGDYITCSAECTIPTGDVQYKKFDAGYQIHLPFGSSGIVTSFATKCGFILAPQRTSIIDRFYLGGATSLRGFQNRGVGPHDLDDAVGGDVFYSVSGMVSVPLPEASLLSQMFSARMHVFANVGELTDLSSAKDTLTAWKGKAALKDKAKALWTAVHDPMRISTGLGVALETALGRIELNYCQVLRSSSTDVASSSFQFGISESFS